MAQLLPDLFASQCTSAVVCQEEIVRRFSEFLAGAAVRVDGSPPMCVFVKHRMSSKPLQVGKYAWIWSERTGKCTGCSFWSVAAAQVFHELACRNPGATPRALDELAQSNSRGPIQLQHEHVFPRQDFKSMVNPTIGVARSVHEAWNLLDKYCQGCVVTREEHLRLPSHGNATSPWMRYRGMGIQLIDNPAWSERHRNWITQAGLI